MECESLFCKRLAGKQFDLHTWKPWNVKKCCLCICEGAVKDKHFQNELASSIFKFIFCSAFEYLYIA